MGMARSRTRHLSFLACSFSSFSFRLEVALLCPFSRCSFWLALTIEELQSYVCKRCMRMACASQRRNETGPPSCILHRYEIVGFSYRNFLLEADLFALFGCGLSKELGGKRNGTGMNLCTSGDWFPQWQKSRQIWVREFSLLQSSTPQKGPLTRVRCNWCRSEPRNKSK